MFTFAESSTLAGITTNALMLSPAWSKKPFTSVLPASPLSGIKRNDSVSGITPAKRPVSSITVTASAEPELFHSEMSTGTAPMATNRKGMSNVMTINDLRATKVVYSRCMMSNNLFIVRRCFYRFNKYFVHTGQ